MSHGKFLGNLQGFFRPILLIVYAVVVTVFFLPAVSGSAVEKSPVFGNISTSAALSAIPPAEIALRASQVSTLLRDHVENFAANAEIDSIRKSLPHFSRKDRKSVQGDDADPAGAFDAGRTPVAAATVAPGPNSRNDLAEGAYH
jgi:hypothetical protein